jgi:hypothetical protein
MEVEIDHGKIVPKEPDKLPERGRGLLTILQPVSHPTPLSQLEAFEELRKSLNLDEAKAQAWIEMIRDARR